MPFWYSDLWNSGAVMRAGVINIDKRKNIIILGTGRSGTSMVAGLFARSGYFMGDHLYPGRDSNPKGFFEDPEINGINEDILSLVQPDWAHPGQQWLSRLPLSTSFSSTPAIDQRIRNIVRMEPFCLKDPRFSYTLPVWRPHLNNTVCICVFRDPAVTVHSILKECTKYYPALPMNQERALQVWALMYRHIERIHRHYCEFIFVHYDQIFDGDVQAKLERITGASLDRSFPDRALIHSVPDFTPPHEIQKLYRNLCELASRSEFSTAACPPDQLYERLLANVEDSTNGLGCAISEFLSRKPDHARAHNDLGVILYQQGAKQDAVRHYEQAVQLNPNCVTFLKNLADYCFVESHEIKRALKLYQRVLSLMPNDVEALVNAGSVYAALQQPRKAIHLLEKALILEPRNHQVAEILERIRSSAIEPCISPFEANRTHGSLPKATKSGAGCRTDPSLMGKLVMTLLVRDEADIVERNIEFHLSQGVDFIIATDNGSVDGTREILSAYARKGKLLLIDEPSQDYAQAVWVKRMAQLAFDEFGAAYIFHCDADEFWSARSGNLKAELGSRSENVLIVPLINVLLRDRSKREHFPEDSVYAIVRPKVTENLEADYVRANLYLFEYPPKVFFSTAGGLLHVIQGNHQVIENASTRKAKSADIRIYHFPIRGYQHFQQKVINGGSSYERNSRLGKSIGFHWRNWYESYRKGALDQEYGLLVIDDRQAERLANEGIIEHFDFSELYKTKRSGGGLSVRQCNYQELT
jgi:hypothetical protein